MYYAIVNKFNQYLEGATGGKLDWTEPGKIHKAAVYPEETRKLWSRLNRSTPTIDELIESNQVALAPHPDYVFCGVEEQGYAIYEVCGDPNYRVLAGCLFPSELQPVQETGEPEVFEFSCL